MDDMREMITTCTATAKEKGFDNTMIMTQLMMIGSEVAEAAVHVTKSGNITTEYTARNAIGLFQHYSDYRATTATHSDSSRILDENEFLEELADIQLRIMSMVGCNGLAEKYLAKLAEKIEKNRHRPRLHGKAF